MALPRSRILHEHRRPGPAPSSPPSSHPEGAESPQRGRVAPRLQAEAAVLSHLSDVDVSQFEEPDGGEEGAVEERQAGTEVGDSGGKEQGQRMPDDQVQAEEVEEDGGRGQGVDGRIGEPEEEFGEQEAGEREEDREADEGSRQESGYVGVSK